MNFTFWGLSIWDIVVLLIYFIVIIYIAIRASLRIKNSEDYFMAGRRFGKLVQPFAAYGQATSVENVTATTDASGHFSIEIKNKDAIRIKNSLFHSYEEKISANIDSLTINLVFNETDKNIGKAIDGGYFTKEDLDYALENLYKENNLYSLYTYVYDAIKYAVPEASMVESAGGGRAFILWGKTSITGNNNAQYLVNKTITGNINYIVPSEIKKIYKFSNSQAALYGSRAANGVICIETY
jgi:hypothetical protein